MDDKKPKIICLTPIKNEAWILDKFLQCASIWADHIIISDQGSQDGSREIAQSYPKVRLIRNKVKYYNEWQFRQIVIDEARKIKGPRLLIAIDADEFFNPGIETTDEWEKILSTSPRTVIKSNFVNILPDMKQYWTGPILLPWGFMDDGSDYIADKIHTDRMINPKDAPFIYLKDIKVLHYQYTDWERMESKHRWYQCWERINDPKKSPVDIYRQYHHMYSIKKEDLKIVPEIWFKGYLDRGIDITSIIKEDKYYWDEKVIKYFNKYDASFFKKEYIWDIDWEEKAVEYGYAGDFKDPRNLFQKIIHSWLKKTQMDSSKFYVRIIDRILKKVFGW